MYKREIEINKTQSDAISINFPKYLSIGSKMVDRLELFPEDGMIRLLGYEMGADEPKVDTHEHGTIEDLVVKLKSLYHEQQTDG